MTANDAEAELIAAPPRTTARTHAPAPQRLLLLSWPDHYPKTPRQRDISEETNYKPMRRLTAFVRGKVQKTGYRAKVVNLGNFLGLTGFVQNLPDGRVKVVAEGNDSILNTIQPWVTS